MNPVWSGVLEQLFPWISGSQYIGRKGDLCIVISIRIIMF